MPYSYHILDFTSKSLEMIVATLDQFYRNNQRSNETRKSYYCGIATDPNDRFLDHEKHHWAIDEIIAVVDCGLPSQEELKEGNKCKAQLVEELMEQEGFDVGDAATKGAGDKTCYVYLVRKGPRVN